MVCDIHTSNAQKDSPFNVIGIHFSGNNLRKDEGFFHAFIVFFIICLFLAIWSQHVALKMGSENCLVDRTGLELRDPPVFAAKCYDQRWEPPHLALPICFLCM